MKKRWLYNLSFLNIPIITSIMLLVCLVVLFQEWIKPTEVHDLKFVLIILTLFAALIFAIYTAFKPTIEYFTGKVSIAEGFLNICFIELTYKAPFLIRKNYRIPIESIIYIKANMNRVGYNVDIFLDREFYLENTKEIDDKYVKFRLTEQSSQHLKESRNTKKVGYLSFSTYEHPDLVKSLKEIVDCKNMIIDKETKWMFDTFSF